MAGAAGGGVLTVATGGVWTTAGVGSVGFSLNPNILSKSSSVKPLRTSILPSSFSILVTGVPAKLLPTVIISVRNSRFVSRFFSSKGRLWDFKYSFSCLENSQLVIV